MSDRSALAGELKELVAWSDYHGLRNRRSEEAAPHLKRIAEKYGVSEMQTEARFWMLVGWYGRTTRIGEEPDVGSDGSLRKGKYGSRRLFSEASA